MLALGYTGYAHTSLHSRGFRVVRGIWQMQVLLFGTCCVFFVFVFFNIFDPQSVESKVRSADDICVAIGCSWWVGPASLPFTDTISSLPCAASRS